MRTISIRIFLALACLGGLGAGEAQANPQQQRRAARQQQLAQLRVRARAELPPPFTEHGFYPSIDAQGRMFVTKGLKEISTSIVTFASARLDTASPDGRILNKLQIYGEVVGGEVRYLNAVRRKAIEDLLRNAVPPGFELVIDKFPAGGLKAASKP